MKQLVFTILLLIATALAPTTHATTKAHPGCALATTAVQVDNATDAALRDTITILDIVTSPAGTLPDAIVKEATKQRGNFITRRFINGEKIPVDSTVPSREEIDDLVIIKGDTVSIIIPQNNYGRYDRGLYNFMFIPRGEWSFGLTASYGEFSSKDIQLLSMIQDLDLNIKAYSLKPNLSYAIANNQTVGLKFNYTRMTGNLGSLTVDIDDDLNFNIGDVSYYSQGYSAGIFYRNYVGLGRAKRFGVFNEIDLSFGSSSSRFKRVYNSKVRDTRTNATTAGLNFSPGVCVFIMDNVSCNVSFGVFGLHMRKETQLTDGVEKGSRFTSGANFKFNIFNINFGMAVHI